MNPTEATASKPVVRAVALTRHHRRGVECVRALDGVSFSIAPGEFVALIGPSGAGKTTLMNLVGCMDTPTSGEIHLNGQALHPLSEHDRTLLRRRHLGFVFQHFGLLSTLNVEENVALPGVFSGDVPRERVRELIERVGLSHRSNHRPDQLSGGEMQRVAIARAIVNRPALLLADEPTGNLDAVTGESIVALFRELARSGLTILAATHNQDLAAAADRRLFLRDGRLEGR